MALTELSILQDLEYHRDLNGLQVVSVVTEYGMVSFKIGTMGGSTAPRTFTRTCNRRLAEWNMLIMCGADGASRCYHDLVCTDLVLEGFVDVTMTVFVDDVGKVHVGAESGAGADISEASELEEEFGGGGCKSNLD